MEHKLGHRVWVIQILTSWSRGQQPGPEEHEIYWKVCNEDIAGLLQLEAQNELYAQQLVGSEEEIRVEKHFDAGREAEETTEAEPRDA